MTEASHQCPWPKCPRRVPVKHWGCVFHWDLVPKRFQLAWRRVCRDDGAEAPELAQISQAIEAWIREEGIFATPLVVHLADSEKAEFAAGLTGDGKVFLFWSLRGEYVALTKDESAIAVKAIRALFSS